ncbi:unnamed protein product (macronuclear) [Paramecium tetraurelia]|uniref:COPI associated protein n=1 Tax=Paramecium tetraurelia TaxID=5888 RepID=A0EDG1_PARTE|nr:uncharacterized protein GSPATT00004197001 [Paramecium tetraurelia]CAK93328.1 unnamed protein product [Paramecium tetraurelia]|eukprot:XP_001460725.1 hypothetical protein (macronuclear) [Paramecium tetraurelia strain d4-2]
MACPEHKANNFIKFISVLVAVVLIVLGVLKFYFTPDIPILVGIWTVYWIIFGLLLILVELNVKLVKEYFGFMIEYCGKGMFVIFCGTLMIDSFVDPHIVHESIVGLLIIFAGFLIIIVGYSAMPSQNFPPPPVPV